MESALYRPVCDLLGCAYPIVAAGIRGVARFELVAAVSAVGAFGYLGMVREPVKCSTPNGPGCPFDSALRPTKCHNDYRYILRLGGSGIRTQAGMAAVQQGPLSAITSLRPPALIGHARAES